VSFAAITLCVASERVCIVYIVIDSVRKLSDIPSYKTRHFESGRMADYTTPTKYVFNSSKGKVVPVL
jgi:hypothetical protein